MLQIAVLLAPTATLADEPRISQPQNQAGVVEGQQLPVRGAGCPGGSIVSFEFNGEPLQAATTANERGRFAAAITVPDVDQEQHPEGGESVLAVSCGGSRAIAIVVVSERSPPPSPTLETRCPPTTIVVQPQQGPPGTTVTVSGAGWAVCRDVVGAVGSVGETAPKAGEPLRDIKLRFLQREKAQVLATVDARADSTFEVQIRLPAPARPGPAILQARFPPTVAAEDPFTVTTPPPRPKQLADTGASVTSLLAAAALLVASGTGLLGRHSRSRPQ